MAIDPSQLSPVSSAPSASVENPAVFGGLTPVNQTPAPPAAGNQWPKLYSGIGQLPTMLDREQQQALQRFSPPGQPDERIRTLNQVFVHQQLPNVPLSSIQSNWNAVRQSFARNYLGHDIGDENAFYQAVGQKLQTDAYGEIKPAGWLDPIKGVWWTHPQMRNLWASLNRPLISLPAAPETPSIPALGPYNPALWAAAYNGGVRPLMEQGSSVLSIGTIDAFGELKLLSQTWKPAKAMLLGMEGVFTGLMGHAAVESTRQTVSVFHDPASTFQDKATALIEASSNAALAATGALGMALEGEVMIKKLTPEMEAKTPLQAVGVLRREAGISPDPIAAAALHNAADHLETLDQPPPEALKPLPETAVYLGKKPLVLEGQEPVDQWQIDQTPEHPRGRTVDRKTLEAEGYAVPVTEDIQIPAVEKMEPEVFSDPQLSSLSAKGAALLESGVTEEGPWLKRMQAETGADTPSLLLVRKMSDYLTGRSQRGDLKKIVEATTGVTEPTAASLVRPLTTNESGDLKTKAKALLQQISGMMSRREVQREFYKGQELAGKAGFEAAKSGAAASNADLIEIRKHLIDLTKPLPLQEKGRFLNAITSALSPVSAGAEMEPVYRRAAHVAFRILGRADEMERIGLAQEIRDIAERTQASPSVDVGHKLRLQDLMSRYAGATLSMAKRQGLESLRDYIHATGSKHEVPPEAVAELSLLSQTPLRELPLDALQALRDKVARLEKSGRLMQQTRQRLLQTESDSITKDLQGSPSVALGKNPVIRHPGENLPLDKKLSDLVHNALVESGNAARRINHQLLTTDTLLDFMDGGARGNGALIRHFKGRMDLDFNTEINYRRNLLNPLVEVMKRNRYTRHEFERISIYAIAREENGVARLLDSGVSPATLAQVKRSITARELEFYGAFRKLADEIVYPALKKFMRDNYNVDVPAVADYWPFQRDWSLVSPAVETPEMKAKEGKEVPFDELAAWNGGLMQDFQPRISYQAAKGMTIARLPEAHGAVRLDAAQVVYRHLSQVAHLLATQRTTSLLGKIAGAKWFGEKYGEWGQTYVRELVDTVARNSRPINSTQFQWMESLLNNTSVAINGLRPISQFKHLGNIPFLLAEVRPEFIVKALAEQASNRGADFIRQHFAEVDQRFGGEQAILNLGNQGLYRQAQQASFVIEKMLDQQISRAAVLGRYLQELHDGGIDPENYDAIPIQPEAQRRALISSRRVVTSPLLKDVPRAISRATLTAGNVSFGRAMFQFQTTLLRQYSYMKSEVFDSVLREMDFNRFATGSLVLLATLSAESGLVRINRHFYGAPKSTQDESFEKTMAEEALRRIPFAGNVNAFVNYGESGTPIIDALWQGGQAASHLIVNRNEYGGKLSPIQQRRYLEQLSASGAAFAGVPVVNQVAQYERNQRKKKNDFTLKAYEPISKP